ncbi:hypothetical protein EDC01DRAFT_626864 [Geopyxis carbonaria]|nr:hypothetical protein EDC01DRAFT_626864 [Geopyxis carbonaria]
MAGIACGVDLRGGLGQQLSSVTVPTAVLNFKLTFIYTFIYPWSSSAVRLSLLIFYRRLAGVADRVVNRIATTLIWATPVYITVCMIINLTICKPFESFWSPLLRDPDCGDKKIHYILLGTVTVSIIADAVILILPIPMIWHTTMALKTRIITCVLLTLGFGSVGVTVFRLVYWETENSATNINVAWDALPYSYWIPCLLEQTFALSASSAPALRPLFTNMWEFGMGTAAPGSWGSKSNSTRESGRRHVSSNQSSGSRFGRRRQYVEDLDTMELVSRANPNEEVTIPAPSYVPPK